MSFTQSSITIASANRIISNEKRKTGSAMSQPIPPPSSSSNKTFEQLVMSSFTCALCRKTLKGPILLPCVFKICRGHAKPLLEDEKGVMMSCPNPRCSAPNKKHKLPENMDDWNVETDETLEALDLLNKRQSLNELIDEFDAGLAKLEKLHNEPKEYFASTYLKKNGGAHKLQGDLAWLVKFADDFMTDANDVVVNFDSNLQAKLSSLRAATTSEDLDLEITKAKTIIDKLNQDRSRTDKLSWTYLNNAFVILDNFKNRSNQFLRQLEKSYAEKVYADELKILDLAKKFLEKLSQIVTKCEETIGLESSPTSSSRPKLNESKLSQIQKIIANFHDSRAAKFKASPIKLMDKSKAHSLRIMCLCWNAQNNTAYSGSDDCSIKKWKLINEPAAKITMVGQLKAHTAKLIKMAVNSEGTLMASGSEDSIVNLWNLRTDAILHMFKNSYGFEFSLTRPDLATSYLATFGENENKKYFVTFSCYKKDTLELDPSSSSFTCGAKVNCAAFSPNSTICLTGLQCGNIELFSLADPKLKPKKIWQRRLSNMNSTCFPIKFIKFANVKQEFVVCCDFGAHVLFEFKSEEIKRKLDLADEDSTIEKLRTKSYMVGLDAASWTRDDKHFVVVNNYIIKIWSTESGRLLHKLNKHMNCVKTLATHPLLSNVIATAGFDRRVLVWNVQDGTVIAKFKPKVISSNEYEHFFAAACWIGPVNLLMSDLDGNLSYFQLPDLQKLVTDPSSDALSSKGLSRTQEVGAQVTANDHLETVTINLASLIRSTSDGTAQAQETEKEIESFTDTIEDCIFSDFASQAWNSQSAKTTRLKRSSTSLKDNKTSGESASKSKRSF